jgi:hypothetical protein
MDDRTTRAIAHENEDTKGGRWDDASRQDLAAHFAAHGFTVLEPITEGDHMDKHRVTIEVDMGEDLAGALFGDVSPWPRRVMWHGVELEVAEDGAAVVVREAAMDRAAKLETELARLRSALREACQHIPDGSIPMDVADRLTSAQGI